jgi:hypothetical protein
VGPAEPAPEPSDRPRRYEAPTEEITIVPPAAGTTASPAAPAPEAAPIPEDDAEATEPDAEDGSASTPAETPAASTPAKPAGKAADETGTKKPAADGPVIDENFDFKALSFAAISAAHKKALGPRTVAGEDETPADDSADAQSPDAPETAAGADVATARTQAADSSPAEAPAADTSDAQASADTAPTSASSAASAGSASSAASPAEAPAATRSPAEAPAQEDDAAASELFASPATRTPVDPTPPSPFPTPTAPQQHSQAARAQPAPSAPHQPPSPFPVTPGGSPHSFPAVHDYAPEASYAGWRPPTPAEESAKRRRYALIAGGTLAVVAVVAVIALIVNMVGRQQWEPIEAMIAEPQEVHPLQLVLGSCVESVPADGEISDVLAVPCDDSHTAQVVGRTDFADAAVWPGRDGVDKRIAQVCGTKQLGPNARTSPVAGSVSYVVWGPSEDSWADGDRVGLCLATTAEPITQDLLQ